MRNKLIIVVGLTLLGQIVLAQSYDITVQITGFESKRGYCVVTLFDDSKPFNVQNKGITQVKKAITGNKTCTVIFEHLPRGVYSIIAFHDENNDGVLNTNLLGLPKECVGNSNNHQGRPSFNKSKFLLQKNESVKIEIKYP